MYCRLWSYCMYVCLKALLCVEEEDDALIIHTMHYSLDCGSDSLSEKYLKYACTQVQRGLMQGPICRGVGGFNPPNDFLTPLVSVDLSSWGGGSILTPVLVLHVSACGHGGAFTLLPVGDLPPPMFFFTNRSLV